MKRLLTALALVALCSVASAQIVFNGVLQLGKVNNVAVSGGPLDVSTEFSAASWPPGFGAANNDIATFTGSAMRIIEGGTVYFVSGSDDWQLDTKITPSGDIGYAGFAINGWSFNFNDDAGSKYFYLGNTSATQSENLTVTDAYLRVKNISGALTFFYSTDGSSYTELQPAEDEGGTPEAATEAGTVVSVEFSGNTGSYADFDYIRFSAP